ncbi:MAG: diguanylate cyclase [Oceanospirillum sp.]|nr:diguanylate cyclase [Oceanospirillum sp.]
MSYKEEWLTTDNQELVPLTRWQNTVNLMASLFRAPAGFIVQYQPEGYRVTIASEQDENPYGAGAIIPPDTNIFCRKIVETQQELYVSHATQDDEWQTNPEVTNDGFNSYLGFPIFWPSGKPFGTICVMDFEVTHYDETYVQLIKQFRDLVQTDLLLVEQFEQIRELALMDELTGLFNRRGLLTVAEQRVQLARRNGSDLALIYLDMDGLKGLNDKIGHEAGDLALAGVGHCIRNNIRGSDVCARLGGDEFLILAETANLNQMESVCERIELDFKALLEGSIKADLSNLGLGLSYGVVAIDDLAQPLDVWVRQADQAMYLCKQARKISS